MEEKLRWRGEWWKYSSEVQNTTWMPRCWSRSGLPLSPKASQDRSPPATVLPLVTLSSLSEGSHLQYGWVQAGLPWVRWIAHSHHTCAEMVAIAEPPQTSLLPLHDSGPENWHGPLSHRHVFTARSSNALIHPPARDRFVWAGLCNKQNINCIRKAFLCSAFSFVLFIFVQQQKQMFFGVCASPDVPFKMLSAVQRRCWFLESRKSCGKLAIWHWKLDFLGAQSIFFSSGHTMIKDSLRSSSKDPNVA